MAGELMSLSDLMIILGSLACLVAVWVSLEWFL